MSSKFINTIVILLLAIYTFDFVKYCIYKPNNLDYFDAELLINYSSGFIRRGLLGELFKYVHLYTHIPILYLTKIFSIIAYSSLIIYFIASFYKKRISLFFLLLPSGLFFLLLDNRIRFRDSLLLLLIIIICKIISLKKIETFYKYFFTSIIISLGTLLHEMFFFYTVPFFALYAFLNKIKYTYISLFILPIFTLAFVTFFHGSENSGYIIFEDLKKIIPNGDFSNELPFSLRAINTEAESLIFENFKQMNIGFSRGLMYIIYFFSLIICFSRYKDLNIKVFGITNHTYIQSKDILFYFLIQILATIPLFFVAVDWQRFINFSILSSFIFCIELKPLNYKEITNINLIFNKIISRYFIPKNKGLTILFSTVILVPHLKLGNLDYLYTNSYLLIFNLFSKILYFSFS